MKVATVQKTTQPPCERAEEQECETSHPVCTCSVEHLLEPVQQAGHRQLVRHLYSFPIGLCHTATPLVNILAGVSYPPFPLASGSD